ncbi:MAG: putative Histidine kinase, partial [Candidatus Saccharibacteria bacterium]|nr:putative Histidine kinase [Candidatus Saccharibacteria bacterium]
MGSMFRSALFKLTAAYVTIVMAISLTFSVILYNLAVTELQTGFQNQYVRWLTEYQPYGLRQPGDPASELAARANHIYAQLVYFNILVFIVIAGASYWLARRTLRPIERAHEQQKRFTADVSHELRTPLTALKMDTEVTLLNKKATIKELRQTLEGNLDETQRMENLVNNLLQLTSLEANQLRGDFSRVNIKELVASALEIVHRYAHSKHITIESTLRDGYVVGDRSSLTQLCIILLENAIKYS